MGIGSAMNSGLLNRASDRWERARRRHAWLDHLVRAGVRFDEADGARLAAANSYYAFFAVFALALLGFAIFGFVLDQPSVLRSVQRYLAQNTPDITVQTLRDAQGTAGIVAFIGLPIAGWFWVDALRSSIRAIWRLPQYPGRFVVRVLVDLTVLTGLGLLLAVSLGLAFATTAATSRVVTAVGMGGWLVAAVALVMGLAVNTLLSVAMLTGLPRLRLPLRRVIGPALLVAVGLELLKTLGRLYVQRIETNPTYQVVAGTVGLLVVLNVVHLLLLYASAITATSVTATSR
ncbi:MAG: YihY/virulence factor BrkB family protein [Micromonosporaceae bacterium]